MKLTRLIYVASKLLGMLFVFCGATLLFIPTTPNSHTEAAIPAVAIAGASPTPTPTCELTWAIVPNPNAGIDSNNLRSVAVISASDISAVGYYKPTSSSASRTLAMHWHGTQSSVVPSLSPASGPNSLSHVAVGSYSPFHNETLVLRYLEGFVTPSPTPTSMPTSTPIPPSPTPIPCTSSFTITGSLMPGDGGQNDYLVRNNDTSVCGVPLSSCTAFLASGTLYDSYTFANNTGAARCVMVTLISSCTNSGSAGSAAYSPIFTGSSCQNILADSGPTPNRDVTYSFTVPAGQPYVVVVSAINAFGATCESYTLTVRDEQAVCATPTPATPTPTATPVSSPPPSTGTSTSTPPTSTPANTIAPSTSTGIATQPTGTPTGMSTSTSTSTPAALTATATEMPPTSTTAASTITAMPTATECSLSFSDVTPTNTFYGQIRCLACRGILSGYADGMFRPNNDITRGQIAKVVSNAAGFNENPGAQIYKDVTPSNTFYAWIDRLSRRGHMGGYPCGTVPSEPCGAGNRPYFRPTASATRGQLAKIVASAAHITGTPTGQRYADVEPDSTFYVWIEQLSNLGIIGGYACGTLSTEPCDEQGRAYFRPFKNVTRGQASKIVANTFLPGCHTP